MSNILKIAIIIFAISACGEVREPEIEADQGHESAQDEFFQNVSSLCGELFAGASTFPDDPGHPLVDTPLRAHVAGCEEDEIKIDFYRDGDTWHATWVLSIRDQGLHLYHDHLGERDEEDVLTGYGGYADDRGDENQQFFPADQATAEMLPEAATNVWMMQWNPLDSTFVYDLERHEESRYRAVLSLQ